MNPSLGPHLAFPANTFAPHNSPFITTHFLSSPYPNPSMPTLALHQQSTVPVTLAPHFPHHHAISAHNNFHQSHNSRSGPNSNRRSTNGPIGSQLNNGVSNTSTSRRPLYQNSSSSTSSNSSNSSNTSTTTGQWNGNSNGLPARLTNGNSSTSVDSKSLTNGGPSLTKTTFSSNTYTKSASRFHNDNSPAQRKGPTFNSILPNNSSMDKFNS